VSSWGRCGGRVCTKLVSITTPKELGRGEWKEEYMGGVVGGGGGVVVGGWGFGGVVSKTKGGQYRRVWHWKGERVNLFLHGRSRLSRKNLKALGVDNLQGKGAQGSGIL